MSTLEIWADQERRAATAAGLWRTLPTAMDSTVVDLSSNDYLGLSQHPQLIQALGEGADRYGAGAGASRLLAGNAQVHLEAEAALAEFVGFPKALLYSSGFAANTSALGSLTGPGDIIFSDALNHASLIDGCRLSRAKVEVFPHLDLEWLQERLATHRSSYRHAWIVSETVFSMDGDEADLAGLRELSNKHGAWLYLDEAHSLGILGDQGRGSCDAAGILPDVLIGTLGKAFGLAGAFVAAQEETIGLLVNRSRSFVYSTGILPALAYSVLIATELVVQADDRREAVKGFARRLRLGLGAAPVHRSVPIVPLVLGSAERATKVSGKLLNAGFRVPPIRPPTVAHGTSRLRITPSSSHSVSEIDQFVIACQRALESR